MMKRCTKCGEEKPFEAFGPMKSGKYGLRPSCKECHAAFMRKYAAEHRDHVLELKRQERATAVEVNNTAGKIIGTAKVQLAYHALRGESPCIPFLAAPIEQKQIQG